MKSRYVDIFSRILLMTTSTVHLLGDILPGTAGNKVARPLCLEGPSVKYVGSSRRDHLGKLPAF